MYDHHKTDGIWIALALVGFEIMDAQACKAAGIALALGEYKAAVDLEVKADRCIRTIDGVITRAKAWERWNRERNLDNLGLALALAGYLTARDRFWNAAYNHVYANDLSRPWDGLPDPTLLAQGDLCDDAAGRLWVRAEARDVGFAS